MGVASAMFPADFRDVPHEVSAHEAESCSLVNARLECLRTRADAPMGRAECVLLVPLVSRKVAFGYPGAIQ